MIKNIKDKNEELINTVNTTNKATKNKTNIRSKKLICDGNHSFAEFKNIDNIKKLSLDSMFNIMKEYGKKFNKLNNLKTRTKDNEKRKQEVLTNVGGIYNRFYYIYENKYNKEINSLDAENKKKFDYKKLRLGDYTYPSEEEEQEDKQDKETTDVNKFNESIIKKGMDIKNMELFNKHFNYQTPSVLLKDLCETKDKKTMN